MRKINLLSLFIFVLLSCTSKYRQGSSEKLIDSLYPKNLTDTTSLKKVSVNNIQEQIQGRWCSIGDTVSTFSINSNEIFYYDASASYKYLLSNDTIKIKYDDYNYQGRIIKKGTDTLIMIGIAKFKGEIDTLFRCSK